jgi:hypothetical protein
MPQNTASGVTYAVGSDAPNIATITQALAASVDAKLIPSFPTAAARAAAITAPTTYQLTSRADAISGQNYEWWNGSAWVALGWTASGGAWTGTRAGTSDNFASGSFVSMLSITLPSNAPAGRYILTGKFSLSGSVAASGNLRVMDPNSVNLSADETINPVATSGRTAVNFSARFTWAGGTGTVFASAMVSTGTGTVYNPGARLDVTYVGP